MKIRTADIESLRTLYKTIRSDFLEKYGKISGIETKEQFDAATKGPTPKEWTQNAIDKWDFWSERVEDWKGDFEVV